ncbi:hypothetical protein CC80DRAFT_553228 [Byssothecium circinans]|uniref:DUF7587 domain-containing protein n=1 Tax=Byssothecium circinans TaxID=147558 RepID=A0A6A5TL80_9PLEO|nr:hypothetical protein CC80DRAFT_553228 [Byssothecium circinans]
MVSDHLLNDRSVCSPFISLTGSLLWALNYAHWSHRRNFSFDIKLWLIDTWKIPEQLVWPAWALLQYLRIQPNRIEWHDDPYHEYLVGADISSEAILGHLDLEFEESQFQDHRLQSLLPALDGIAKTDGLLSALEIFRGYPSIIPRFEVELQDHDLRAAVSLAKDFGLSSKLDWFSISNMLLSLKPRKWNARTARAMINFFNGTQLPALFLYRCRDSIIPEPMIEVVEWVKAMEYIRFRRSIDKALGFRSQLEDVGEK